MTGNRERGDEGRKERDGKYNEKERVEKGKGEGYSGG